MTELKNKKILIVDDEKQLLNIVGDLLYSEGYSYVYRAESCAEAIKIAKEQPIALFIFDVSLPDGNGFSLYNKVREFSKAPVIFLTARGESDDRIKGLWLGADDYIVKPFLGAELILRINGVLRRTYQTISEVLTFSLSDRQVDFERGEIICPNKTYTLTAKEFILLKKLWENKNKIVTNDALCMAAWGDEYYGYENTLMVHIRRLRKKIELNPSNPKHLITVKGLGYKLVIENE